MKITGTAPQLLIAFDYDQSVMAGPPFAVGREEVERLYASSYWLTLLARPDVQGGLKGQYPAWEGVWLLTSP